MVELHGWAKLALSTDGENEEDIGESIRMLMPIVNEADSAPCRVAVFPLNGHYHLSVSGLFNHRSSQVDEVMNIFELIATNFKGAYGLLHLRDDEDASGNDNNFVVYKLYRGRIDFSIDTMLSPCIPTIEDELE